MISILEDVETYWTGRADGYSQSNIKELDSFKRQAWTDLITAHAPVKAGERLKVLDIGTGPGFFAIIMAACGHDVTAVDYTEEMLDQARANAVCHMENILFCRMDAQQLDFEENSFDLIVTRNLTWNLENPQQAYREWHRVLSPGGRLLNFDANWYLHVHDAEKRLEYEQDRINTHKNHYDDHYNNTDIEAMEAIARKLPLSRINRPEWDASVLLGVGFKKVLVETALGEKVWDEEEKVNYGSTPMFMVMGEK
jgi:SAM-dependent methyltransferase